ncbi:MAG: hypothetical protein ABL878_11430 [Burkholderiales bacterium]
MTVTTLTLFIPDLFRSGNDASVYANLILPALESLLSQGDLAEFPCEDENEWLCRRFGVARQQDWPVAPLTGLGLGLDIGTGYWLHADPVQLAVDRDRLVLNTRNHISATHTTALLESLNQHFASSGLQFHAPQTNHWFVNSPQAPLLRTTTLANAMGRNIDRLLPTGQDGKTWQALFNETQMLLHEHPVNVEREQQGESPVNSLWFWGGGTLPAAAAPYDAVFGHSPLLKGLCRQAGVAMQPVPGQFLATGGQGLFVELAEAVPTDRWRESLCEQDTTWFRPIAQALRAGHLSELRIATVQNGRSLEWVCRRSDAWKFWRRQRPLADFAGSETRPA